MTASAINPCFYSADELLEFEDLHDPPIRKCSLDLKSPKLHLHFSRNTSPSPADTRFAITFFYEYENWTVARAYHEEYF
jgi:hypothetical protein